MPPGSGAEAGQLWGPPQRSAPEALRPCHPHAALQIESLLGNADPRALAALAALAAIHAIQNTQ